MRESRLGGLLVRVERHLHFIPAGVALRIAQVPDIVRIPGAPIEVLGMAAFEGDVIPVVTVGDDRSVMVVCSVGGDLLGVVGASVVGAGIFERTAEDDQKISFSGELAQPLNLAELHARLRGDARADRWRV